MDSTGSIFPDFLAVFRIFWTIVIHGGWIAFIALAVVILFTLYWFEIKKQFRDNIEWVFLSIRMPQENLVSAIAIEQIYSQLHALHTTLTFTHRYVEGKVQMWYSLELISLGGKISYVIRTPVKMRDLVEAAFYAQYPEAEITEVADYMENMHYDPDKSDVEIFGFEVKLEADQVLPIKTYKDFEHPAAEQKIIDPLAPLFESLGKMEPYEFYGVQIVIQPLADDEWIPLGEAKSKELLGEEVEEHMGSRAWVLKIVHIIVTLPFILLKFATQTPSEHEKKTHEDGTKSKWMGLTDVEKERINLIQRKISKPGYKTKIRHLYIAPKDKFDNNKKGMAIGAFRTLGSAQTNKMKPDVKHTWTAKDYIVSPGLEAPYIDWLIRRRKRHIFHGYKTRSIIIGLPQFIMNTEELATLYHLPLSVVATKPSVDQVGSKKSQAPINLPIADYEL